MFNDSRITSVIVCALSSNAKVFHEPGNVLLQPGEGGLPKPCAIVVSQISTVDKHRLAAYIGALSAARVDEALAGLRLQQNSFFRRAVPDATQRSGER